MSDINNLVVKLLWPQVGGGTRGIYELIKQEDDRATFQRVSQYMLAEDNPQYLKMQNGHFGALKRAILASEDVSDEIRNIFNHPDFTKKGAVEALKKLYK